MSETSDKTVYIDPVADEHLEKSRGLILHACEAVAQGSVLILGVGRAEEIPLAELARRFGRIVLNDIDAALVGQAVARAGLSPEATQKIETNVADLTGATEALAQQAEQAIAAAGDAMSAITALVAVLDGTSPLAMTTTEKFDFVVASCLLSQLHVPASERLLELFDRCFTHDGKLLRESQPWKEALYRFARKTEAALVNDLARLVAPGGRIYLSETVQACFVEAAANGKWATEGTYRMTLSLNLTDYLDSRFRVYTRARWNWVVAPPSPGERGRLFDVQALVLGLNG